MNHALVVALAERILAHVDAGTTDMDTAVHTQPVASYLDADRLEREVSAVFRGRPLIVCHGSQIPEPGDFVARDLAGVPVVAARGDDGAARVLVNVCRHRGTRVVGEPCGRARSFACPYHGWTYGRDGALRAIPHPEGFDSIDPATRGLVALPSVEAHGFVWAHASAAAGATPEVTTYLGALADDLDSFGFADHHVYASRTATRAINWKLAIDIFLESYHIRWAHRSSIYPMFFDNTGIVDHVEPHLRNVFPKRSIRALRDLDRAEWSLREHANILYHVFPNTLILVQPDHAAVLHVFPDGVEACRIDSYTLVPERPASERAKGHWNANNDILYAATAEDFALGETIQAGLRSGANEALTFGRYEHALGYFHAAVEAALRSG